MYKIILEQISSNKTVINSSKLAVINASEEDINNVLIPALRKHITILNKSAKLHGYSYEYRYVITVIITNNIDDIRDNLLAKVDALIDSYNVEVDFRNMICKRSNKKNGKKISDNMIKKISKVDLLFNEYNQAKVELFRSPLYNNSI